MTRPARYLRPELMPARKSALTATAYYEAGHAVAAWKLGIRIESISIIPTTDSKGHVVYGPYLKGVEIRKEAIEAVQAAIASRALQWAQSV